ncbi:hypothetical protein [Actinacidiphila sp. ITFR-21]|uniref:hypothetical protein n=1 Tax=Actinacidiphila sp. ITFR-21 TaxID=3075199 RepID=UPI00288BD59D|nr:hypothetical protein [Streptomyces sp. ITFR-21]WNI20361.1 hypothetical protein RLT57_32680 [Streptomyces sp. ITFR-21]
MARHEVTTGWGSPPTPEQVEQRNKRAKAHRRSTPAVARDGQEWTDRFPWSWRRR